MDCLEMKQQAVDEIKKEIFSFLKEIEPQVIADITQKIKSEYDEKIYDLETEIKYLKKYIKTLEESISWTAHKLGIDLIL